MCLASTSQSSLSLLTLPYGMAIPLGQGSRLQPGVPALQTPHTVFPISNTWLFPVRNNTPLSVLANSRALPPLVSAPLPQGDPIGKHCPHPAQHSLCVLPPFSLFLFLFLTDSPTYAAHTELLADEILG
jgi:hypothetical protein